MTEAEWRKVAEVSLETIEFLQGRTSERKVRLLNCACLDRVREHLPDTRCRTALEAAEMHADGHIDTGDLVKAHRATRRVSRKLQWLRDMGGIADPARRKTIKVTLYASWAAETVSLTRIDRRPAHAIACARLAVEESATDWRRAQADEEAAQISILRDIFGNPFRPVAPDPSWRTSAALALAGRMYETRDFSPMPILGDALQEAGCGHADVLDHCRGPGPHVRGCWVVDLILGKS